ncbi:MAG TPA: hypothetical protein VF193_18405 [Steroidobacter sp.]
MAALLTSASGAVADEAASPPPEKPPKSLDLRAPDITKLFTPEQIERALAKSRSENIEEVEVEGARVPPPAFTPPVWPGIAAPVWAILHPTEAWRIIAPLPPDQARQLEGPRDMTEGYLEPAARMDP